MKSKIKSPFEATKILGTVGKIAGLVRNGKQTFFSY